MRVLNLLCLLPFLAASMAHASTDSVQVSFKSIHSAHRNWLQVQAEPVGACQEIVVDSVRVLDERIATYRTVFDTATGLTLRMEVLVVPFGDLTRRDLKLAWHLAATDPSRGCGAVKAARHMLEIPPPPKSPGSDTLLQSWAVGQVDAMGPNGRDTLTPDLLDQSGELHTFACPVYDVWCPNEIAFFGTDSAMALIRDSVLTDLRQRVAAGLTLVRVGATLANQGIRKEIPWGGTVLSSRWEAGNRSFAVSHPMQVRRSWGPAPAREVLERETGERIDLWNNAGLVPIGDTLAASGPDLELSNDSTALCEWLKMPDHAIAQDLAKNDWLLFLDTAEVRTGVLGATFKRNYCGIRGNAKAILNDSVFLGGVRIPMALLDQALDVPSAVRRGAILRISAVPTGLRVAQGADLTESVKIRVRTASGRLVTQALLTSREAVLPVSGHGIFLVEAESSRGIAVVRAVR